MSGVSLKVDDSGSHVVAAGSELGEVYLMHSGALPEAISVEPGGENRTLVCVGVRCGVVLVTIAYSDDSLYEDQSWEVFPGAPLKVLANEVPETVTIEQVGSELPQIEALVAESGVELLELEFLVLNAGAGVRLGVGPQSDVVLGWRDTRPISGAPAEFSAWSFITNGGAQFIESDPDFAGKPSVEWTETQTAGYRYSDLETGLWDFMGLRGEFLFMAIMKPPVDRGWTGNTFWRRELAVSGLDLAIDPGYRVKYTVNNPDEVEESATGTKEIIEDGTSMVFILRKSSAGLQLYRQGEWVLLGSPTVGSYVDSLDRPVLGISGSGGIDTNLKFADIRIWKTMPDDVQSKIDEYIEMAVSEYGADDSVRQGHPWVSNSYAMFRANRGVQIIPGAVITDKSSGVATTFVGTAVAGWYDPRPEGPEFDFYFVGDTGLPETLPSLEEAGPLDGHMAIRGYGGGASGVTDTHRLIANTAVVPLLGGEFTIPFVIQPDSALGSTWKGGAVLATGGSGGLDVFYLSITTSGAVFLFIARSGEDDIELSLPIGPQVFGHALAVILSVSSTSIQLKAEDLTTGSQYSAGMSVAWGGVVPSFAMRLFDFDSYYAASQWFEGKISELTFIAENASNATREEWFTYCRRRYRSGIDWPAP